MTRVYSHPDPSIAHLVHNRIVQLGVPAVIQGNRAGAAMGEVPPIAAWSEVWVPDSAVDQVAAVVAEVTTEPDGAAESWTCACGETLDGAFGMCWSCGTDAPEA